MKRPKFFTLIPAVGVAFALLYTLSASPGHGYVSVAAGGFSPNYDECDYTNTGNLVQTSSGSCTFRAPVQLPHGATVTTFSSSWWDGADENGYANLARVNAADSLTVDSLANLWTDGNSGSGTSETTTIAYSLIDNTQYAYFLEWAVPAPGVSGGTMVIEYTYPTGLPLVLRNFQEAVRRR